MPRGPKKQWRAVLPHTQAAFPYVHAAMQAGYDVPLKVTEVTAEEKPTFRRGLFNAAKHLGVSLHCEAVKEGDGTYTLTYAVHQKATGRAHVLAKHGKDRTGWPYDPRQLTTDGSK